MRGLTDKVVLVAGGAGGIGTASSVRLAEEGARVVVGDVNGAAAESVARQVTDAGGDAIAVECDIADEGSVEALVAAAVDEFGGIDRLHCNAAALDPDTIGNDTDVETISLDVFDHTLAVNLRGHVLCTRHAIPRLLERGDGAIVYTASVAAFVGEPARPSYAIAKSGLTALTRHVASNWGKRGLRGERGRARARDDARDPRGRGRNGRERAQASPAHPQRNARRRRRRRRLPALRRRGLDQRPGHRRRRRNNDEIEDLMRTRRRASGASRGARQRANGREPGIPARSERANDVGANGREPGIPARSERANDVGANGREPGIPARSERANDVGANGREPGIPARSERANDVGANARGAGTLRRRERARNQVKRRMETLATRPTQANVVMSELPP